MIDRQKVALRVSGVTIIGNVLLTLFKLFAGVAAHSGAMLSDAVHSASDVLSTVVVIVGVRLGARQPDREHPYGHERLECAAAVVLAAMLFATGAGIGYAGIGAALRGGSLQSPGLLALAAAAVSIAVKEAMYWYTRAAARQIHSSAVMADAWHHRSDALSSIGSFVGILGARLGLPVLDPVASVIISGFILKAAVDIFRDAIGKMTDRACGEELEREITAVALRQRGVLGVDRINTRLFGDRIYVELEICADGSATLSETHEIAERVHDAVEGRFERTKHCMVHVNPACGAEDRNEMLQCGEGRNVEETRPVG